MSGSNKPIYILGTGLSHNSSVCLLKDGKIAVAIEKERLTRVKNDGSNDSLAIKYCLEAEGITIDDISMVVQNANFCMFEQGSEWFGGERPIPEYLPKVTISHHLAHAYSAIGTSPFDEAAVLVIDGCGNSMDDVMAMEGDLSTKPLPPVEARHLYFETDSFYSFKDGRMKPVFKDYSPWGFGLKGYYFTSYGALNTVGGLYSAAAIYIFGGFLDAGKVMGLAPYGKPGVYKEPIFFCEDGRVSLNHAWMKTFVKPSRSHEQFKADFQYYADLAYWVQKETERAILYIVDQRYQLAPSDNLAYAGGVALNAVANRRIIRESRFKNLYIQPAAQDNGLAIGCAYYGWLEVLGKELVKHNGSSCFGRTYPPSKLQSAISKYSKKIVATRDPDYIETTAQYLADGKKIGWVQDGSEFGPRALGHRSILAHPANPETRHFINREVKFREDFRPFAPSVPLDDLGDYFDCDYESPYMILVAPVREEKKHLLESVVHLDNSSRIQTVTEASDPRYYRLLKEFGKRSGAPVLLNTSLNRRGMPIVETPEEAIDFFLNCALDVMVIGEYVIQKQELLEPQPSVLGQEPVVRAI